MMDKNYLSEKAIDRLLEAKIMFYFFAETRPRKRI